MDTFGGLLPSMTSISVCWGLKCSHRIFSGKTREVLAKPGQSVALSKRHLFPEDNSTDSWGSREGKETQTRKL